MNLMGYFGLYFLTSQLDLYVAAAETYNKMQILPAAIGLEAALIM